MVASIYELAVMLKDRRPSKTGTENGLDIQTISAKRTDLKGDHVLLFGKMIEEKPTRRKTKRAKFSPSKRFQRRRLAQDVCLYRSTRTKI